MNSEFGDIELFCRALQEDPAMPSVRSYLGSIGLSESEIREVLPIFEKFCVAIENAETMGLPGDPNVEQETVPATAYSAN